MEIKISIDKIEERRKYRDNLLLDLYKHHFESGGSPTVMSNRLDKDTNLAYEYLVNSGYVISELDIIDSNNLTISVSGIDYIEDKIIKGDFL